MTARMTCPIDPLLVLTLHGHFGIITGVHGQHDHTATGTGLRQGAPSTVTVANRHQLAAATRQRPLAAVGRTHVAVGTAGAVVGSGSRSATGLSLKTQQGNVLTYYHHGWEHMVDPVPALTNCQYFVVAWNFEIEQTYVPDACDVPNSINLCRARTWNAKHMFMYDICPHCITMFRSKWWEVGDICVSDYKSWRRMSP